MTDSLLESMITDKDWCDTSTEGMICGGQEELLTTLFHEIHACSSTSLRIKYQEKAPLEKPEFEEAVVNQLTNVMMGVFRDNAWMVDMLKDQLEETDHDVINFD